MSQGESLTSEGAAEVPPSDPPADSSSAKPAGKKIVAPSVSISLSKMARFPFSRHSKGGSRFRLVFPHFEYQILSWTDNSTRTGFSASDNFSTSPSRLPDSFLMTLRSHCFANEASPIFSLAKGCMWLLFWPQLRLWLHSNEGTTLRRRDRPGRPLSCFFFFSLG